MQNSSLFMFEFLLRKNERAQSALTLALNFKICERERERARYFKNLMSVIALRARSERGPTLDFSTCSAV